jgi:phage repressor protein C with HTH and peptisase S24 domain
MIKRVQPLHDKNKLRVISDNKSYESLEIDADKVKVKLIWFAREIKR